MYLLGLRFSKPKTTTPDHHPKPAPVSFNSAKWEPPSPVVTLDLSFLYFPDTGNSSSPLSSTCTLQTLPLRTSLPLPHRATTSAFV